MEPKRYGIIGLGRMGGAMVRNLHRAGGHAVVFDLNPDAVAEQVALGATGVANLTEMAAALPHPRVIWMMVPAGAPVDATIAELKPSLQAGDVLIDGGNSNFNDSVRRAKELKEAGIYYLDSGSSGGLEGALNGLCLMVGGEPEAYAMAEPLFAAIAQPGGYIHVGPSGAGHYVKMTHNAIEYAFLQALGEGFELLEAGPYDLDKAKIAHLWNHGSIIRCWLLDLAARALENDPHLDSLTGNVGGGSTGSWAIEEAWKVGVPLPSIALSYAMRLRSRQNDTFTGKMVAALRWEFGGHPFEANK